MTTAFTSMLFSSLSSAAQKYLPLAFALATGGSSTDFSQPSSSQQPMQELHFYDEEDDSLEAQAYRFFSETSPVPAPYPGTGDFTQPDYDAIPLPPDWYPRRYSSPISRFSRRCINPKASAPRLPSPRPYIYKGRPPLTLAERQRIVDMANRKYGRQRLSRARPMHPERIKPRPRYLPYGILSMEAQPPAEEPPVTTTSTTVSDPMDIDWLMDVFPVSFSSSAPATAPVETAQPMVIDPPEAGPSTTNSVPRQDPTAHHIGNWLAQVNAAQSTFDRVTRSRSSYGAPPAIVSQQAGSRSISRVPSGSLPQSGEPVQERGRSRNRSPSPALSTRAQRSFAPSRTGSRSPAPSPRNRSLVPVTPVASTSTSRKRKRSATLESSPESGLESPPRPAKRRRSLRIASKADEHDEEITGRIVQGKRRIAKAATRGTQGKEVVATASYKKRDRPSAFPLASIPVGSPVRTQPSRKCKSPVKAVHPPPTPARAPKKRTRSALEDDGEPPKTPGRTPKRPRRN